MFSMPETLLGCVYEAETGSFEFKVSGSGARGISQLMPAAYTDIRKLILTGGSGPLAAREVNSRWWYYERKLRQLGIPIASTRDGTFGSLTRDPSWSVGTGALWLKYYAAKVLPGQDLRTASLADLAVLAGAYNQGAGGFWPATVAAPGGLRSCVGSLQARGHRSGSDYIKKIYGCLLSGSSRSGGRPSRALASRSRE